MSSIMDRLRSLEGASSSGRPGRGTGVPPVMHHGQDAHATFGTPAETGRKPSRNSRGADSVAPASDLPQERPGGVMASRGDTRPGRGTGVPPVMHQMLAGLLVICAVFLLWRAWKGRPLNGPGTPPKARLAQVSAEAAGRPEKPRGTIAAEAGPHVPAESAVLSTEEPSEGKPSVGSSGSQRETDPAPTESVDRPSQASELRAGEGEPRLGGAALQQKAHPWERASSGSAGHLAPSGVSEPQAGSPASDDASQRRAMIPFGAGASAAGTLTPQEDQRTKTFLLNLKVSGVYMDPDGGVLLINGRAFQKGDRIGEVEILEITSERATFGYKGKHYLLPIR